MSVLLSVNKISTDYPGTHSIDQAGNRPIFLYEGKKKNQKPWWPLRM